MQKYRHSIYKHEFGTTNISSQHIISIFPFSHVLGNRLNNLLFFPFEWVYTINFGALNSVMFGVSLGPVLKAVHQPIYIYNG